MKKAFIIMCVLLLLVPTVMAKKSIRDASIVELNTAQLYMVNKIIDNKYPVITFDVLKVYIIDNNVVFAKIVLNGNKYWYKTSLDKVVK